MYLASLENYLVFKNPVEYVLLAVCSHLWKKVIYGTQYFSCYKEEVEKYVEDCLKLSGEL